MTLELGLIIGLSVLLAIVCICQYKKNHEMVKALSEKEDALKRLIQELPASSSIAATYPVDETEKSRIGSLVSTSYVLPLLSIKCTI